jgi:hypothetical protein
MTLPAERSPIAKAPRRWARRVARALLYGLIGIALFAMSLWAVLAIYYAGSGTSPRPVRAILFALAIIASIIFIRPKKIGFAAVSILFGAVLCSYLSIKPRNDRDWLPDVARVAHVTIDGDQITVHNVRNFDYRSETDFTPRWEDRTYSMDDLRTVDLLLNYWGSKDIAHGMVSFGFTGGRYLCVSIETRKQVGEEYSAVQGFFRQYELIYIFGDERDLIRLRTEFRNEEVYLYKTNLTPQQARAVLMSYADRADSLESHPEFYNALTSNCVTNVVDMGRVINPNARISWEILLSGYAARVAYRNGRLDTSMPYEELEAKSHINIAAHNADNDLEFSTLIRAGVPDPLQKVHD